MSERITPEHALRGPRWYRALARVNKTVSVPALRLHGIEIAGDAEIAAEGGLRVVRSPSGRLKIDTSPARRRDESRFRDLVRETIDALSEGTPPSRVVEVVGEGGRKTYKHDLLTRTAQVAIAQLLTPHAERVLAPTSFAYRPGVSREHAAYSAQRLMHAGYRYAAKADIRKCFDNVHAHQIERAACELLPGVTRAMLRFLIATTAAPIMRAPSHPEVRVGAAPTASPPKHTILQGSVLGPMQSNLVLHAVIDAPFSSIMRRDCIVLRWSDDVLLLGRTEAAVRDGLAVFRALAEAADFQLHPDKTDVDPRYTALEPVVWVGRRISAAGVEITREEIERMIERIMAADPDDPDDRGAFVQLAHALLLEPWARVGDIAVEIHERCGEERWLAFDIAQFKLKTQKRSRRFRSYESTAAKIMFGVAA